MSHIFNRLAASKLASYIGAALVFMATICTTMRAEVGEAFPTWGIRACAMMAIAGGMLGLFGKGVADRRSGTVVPTVVPAPGLSPKPNERGAAVP